ncbi:DUF4012 domain-containing protein [Micromonospora sagamiensis]|uniref:Uncharacterized protein DUF4012 n=1 Tax=Micromonospora sagamiensis TaxID=47875 RepID=A0A562WG22_9ACTN|nr:DUF4012 domain-containing protein [Micromonospora sagamiensis]TWJ29259.1 uncharacterized protein DUF4012 [Micromonospora sagamiensis]BCL17715.1 hypothetical protein GCM10017556_54540 [Micromonospora sagamiensis]
MTTREAPWWRRRARSRLRRAAVAGLLALSLSLAAVGWVAFRGWQARDHLLGAAELARELSTQVAGGDVDRARGTLTALQERAAAARRATADPGWALGRRVPVAGDDLSAVRQVAVAVDDLARRAFPRLLDVDLDTLLPRQGRLDLAGLRAAERELAAADEVVRQAQTRLGAVPTGGLTRQVGAAVGELRGEVDRLAGLTGAVSRGAALLPPLLGVADGREYLLVSQNLAELRATGGMFGAYAVVRAEQGRVRLVRQGTAGQLGHFLPPLPGVSREMRGLYTDLPGIWPADVNLTPHFPTAAALYHEMYRRRTGETVDGVLATDPVALSYLLAVTGPVEVPGFGLLSSGNAVRSLLSESYLTLDLRRQDEFFARSAATVFETLLARPVPPRELLSAFDRSVDESRILFWSAHPEEQRTLGESRLAGVLPERETEPSVGVFLNDGSGAKLGYYLKPSAELTVGTCRPDGRRELRLRMSLHSSAPTSGLTPSVLGVGRTGDPYVVRTLVYVFSPAGGAVLRARLDGVEVALGSGTERRRQVAIATVEAGPGKTRSLEVDLLTDRSGTGGAELRLTPTATPWTTHIQTASRCNQ